MSLTPIRKVMLGVLAILLLAVAACWRQASPPPAPLAVTLTTVAHWGIGALTPTVWSSSNQVVMTPTVMNLGAPGGMSQIAFVSFDTLFNASNDRNGVLRVLDQTGNELARFPNSVSVTIPASCTTFYGNLNTVPHLSPMSGVTLGKLFPGQPAFIIGVLDDHVSSHGGIIAFKLIGNLLMPQWCSQPLPAGDLIPVATAPTIAQLEPHKPPSIVIDNKVYDGFGNLRYTGGTTHPRSHTAIVANLTGGNSLPQVITGGAIYASTSNTTWTNPTVTLLPGGGAYPAVADLDLDTHPEIVVVEPVNSKLFVISATGTLITSIGIPTSYTGCGGPPMIGDVDGDGKPEIGVASCSQYTVFKYNNGTLSVFWSAPIIDFSGRTTSTLFKDPSGLVRIYYGGEGRLWVFNGVTGNVIQSLPNSSFTAMEGPIIASLDANGSGQGRLIVAANLGSLGGGVPGLLIFSDPNIGSARSFWNAHTYHRTNVSNAFGSIPFPEPPSWFPPVNSYRVQQQ